MMTNSYFSCSECTKPFMIKLMPEKQSIYKYCRCGNSIEEPIKSFQAQFKNTNIINILQRAYNNDYEDCNKYCVECDIYFNEKDTEHSDHNIIDLTKEININEIERNINAIKSQTMHLKECKTKIINELVELVNNVQSSYEQFINNIQYVINYITILKDIYKTYKHNYSLIDTLINNTHFPEFPQQKEFKLTNNYYTDGMEFINYINNSLIPISKIHTINVLQDNQYNIEIQLKNRITYLKYGLYIGDTINKDSKGTLIDFKGEKYVGYWSIVNGNIVGLGKKYYKNGDIGFGTFSNFKREGYCKRTWKVGGYVQGNYKNGLPNGFIELSYSDRDLFIGEYKDGKAEGYGQRKYPTGDTFEGEYRDDEKLFGIYISLNGNKYEGEWKNNECEGYGIRYYINGDNYKGEWKNGNAEGYGIKYFNNGDKYKGEWKNDKMEGYGIYIWKDGRTYQGYLFDNKSKGYGIQHYSDGKYKGNWKDDLKNGYGVYQYKNGDRYEGEWKESKKEGYGLFYFNNGEKHEGIFKNGLIEGVGCCYNSKGDLYQGEYKKGKPKGICTIIYKNGDRYEGENENFIKKGKGMMYYSNGDRYEGEWNNDMKNGEGTMYYKNGKIEQGNWEKDKFKPSFFARLFSFK